MEFKPSVKSNWAKVAGCLVVGAISLTLAGCGGSSSDSPEPSATNQQTSIEPAPSTSDGESGPAAAQRQEQSDAEALESLAGQSGQTKTNLSAGDKAWQEVQQATRLPSPPQSWETNRPSEKELAAWREEMTDQAIAGADKAKEFYDAYPEHSQAGAAKQKEYQMLSYAVQNGATNQASRLQDLEEARLADSSTSDEEKLILKIQQLQRKAVAKKDEGIESVVTVLEEGAQELLKEYPDESKVYKLILSGAYVSAQAGKPDQAKRLAQQVVDADVSQELTQTAQKILSMAQGSAEKQGRVGKPLDLEFTSVRGNEIDLDDLEGKVVLIDFWATWCGPCIQELPNVKKVYNDLHPKGFEIVGISFDSKKEKLLSFIKRENMTWPQYFDGKKWDNEIGNKYGITAIPAMWLVDKNGVLRDVNARRNLEEKVKELLAETPEEAEKAVSEQG